jgi:hypothetical protein
MTDDPLDAMKARWSYIQGFLFPWMREDNDPITEALGRLVTTLDVIGLEAFVPEPPRGPGRPPEDRRALARAFVAKAVLGVPTTSALIERLDVDKSLRRILGWERRSQVPSEATFSRAFAEFARGALPDKIHAALIERALGGRIIGAIARDATEIEAREKPVQNKANDGKDDPPAPDNPAPPRKRGRPRKDEQRPKPEPTRLKRQVTQSLSQMLADLPTACDVGCKKNSKGDKETWTGYKLHIDVACGQIPVSCVLTSASVHDSQVAIPLMTMTSARVSYLCDLMDAAYDAAAIHDQSRALGHAPIVDRNFRPDHQAKAEWGREVQRLKLIHRPDFDGLIYDFRTMAERVNARLKDEFGARFLRVRGALITGPANQPSFQISSQPSLPEDEILSRVLFQRPSGSLSAFQAIELTNAVATLSGNGDAFERLRRTLGVDSLDLSTSATGGALVGATRAINDRISVGVTTGARPQDNGVNVDLDVTRHLRLQAGVDASGGSSAGIGAEWEYK